MATTEHTGVPLPDSASASVDQLDPTVDRLLRALPGPARRSFVWLTRPRARWVRLPLGVALIAGGLFGFLPVVGFWMLPIGALLIGEDMPPVRRATLRLLTGLQREWDARRLRKRL